MKARPILLSAPMIRALLAGTKTQTRRLCKGQRELSNEHDFQLDRCPYGQANDLLWVKEAWTEAHPLRFPAGREPGVRLLDAGIPGPPPVHYLVAYRADGELLPIWHSTGGHPYRSLTPGSNGFSVENDLKWHPQGVESGWDNPMFMRRRASRLTLRITDVRVQRLHQISEEDARAEGVELNASWAANKLGYVSAFGNLWAAINGPGSWGANPWVWALTFEVIKTNVDLVLANKP